MAVSMYDPIMTHGKGRIIIAGMLYPQTAATPLFGSTALKANASATKDASSSASGYTVARAGLGLFTVTITDANVREIIAVIPVPGLGTAANTTVQTGPMVLSAGVCTFQLQVLTAGVAADIAAGVDNRIGFIAILRRSSVRG